ncbi:ATP-binding cassette domain-containing protein [Ignatzschineria cameli]|uniref:ATP-binding cassette domain-containing protein n=1 Tax=Ignatzschineria cameli TaxID=2182793 RepID=UPI000D6221F6|nr:ATP-binding cassette domain-containing protein [Ignatzschineria cameli]PWD87266.1 ABC transporter ATP-binding protein [Ignatzschineria cameli]
MVLLRLQDVSLAYGAKPLLKDVKFAISKGERVCLVGRNGEGKSSLLKVVSQEIIPDGGEVVFSDDLKVAKLDQEIPADLEQTVYEVVTSGLSQVGEKLQAYHAMIDADDVDLTKLGVLQSELDRLDAWTIDSRVAEILTRLELDGQKRMNELSGGWIRRVLLARVLVSDPDLILLDEPTNHLDIEMIEWLEKTLVDLYRGALLFVSHDRQFLDNVATKIIELDRGNLTEYPGSFADYQRFKEIELHNEAQENALFDKRLAEEEVWIRQGIKARRTRNEGRVRALKAMRQERKERLDRQGTALLHHEEAQKSGRRVLYAEDISYSIAGKTLIKDFTFTLMRGDKVGIIGPNGVGKSTLVKLLMGDLTPDSGEIERGTQLEIAYFDQLRTKLDLDATVSDNVADGSDFIELKGKKRHVISWLQDFMFTPERARSPVKSLSGGERNRLLLAKLFTKPFNFLVMDEPTNDLDIETLELLEELVANYEGTLLLISHDRAFLDSVVTSVLVFEGEGKIGEYIGGYSDWQERLKLERAQQAEKIEKTEATRKREKSSAKESPDNGKTAGNDREKAGDEKKPRKLTFKETHELAQLPEIIAQLESDIESLESLVQSAQFYQESHLYQTEKLTELAKKSELLEEKYERWLELENIQ